MRLEFAYVNAIFALFALRKIVLRSSNWQCSEGKENKEKKKQLLFVDDDQIRQSVAGETEQYGVEST